jgi:hypothetical protein
MKFFVLYFSALIISFSAFSQSVDMDVIATSGANGSSPTHQLSWTIGEPIIETLTQSSNILTQGFHQTNLVVTDITEQTTLNLELVIYPNPVVNQLNLNIENPENLPLNYVLYDEVGRVLSQDRIYSNQSSISMENLSRANYLLAIYSGDSKVKVFKVIKMN